MNAGTASADDGFMHDFEALWLSEGNAAARLFYPAPFVHPRGKGSGRSIIAEGRELQACSHDTDGRSQRTCMVVDLQEVYRADASDGHCFELTDPVEGLGMRDNLEVPRPPLYESRDPHRTAPCRHDDPTRVVAHRRSQRGQPSASWMVSGPHRESKEW